MPVAISQSMTLPNTGMDAGLRVAIEGGEQGTEDPLSPPPRGSVRDRVGSCPARPRNHRANPCAR